MATVSIREIRNHGGEVVDRVVAGEQLTITRDGRPVAELRPIGRPILTATELLGRWRTLPQVELKTFRRDLDEELDARL